MNEDGSAGATLLDRPPIEIEIPARRARVTVTAILVALVFLAAVLVALNAYRASSSKATASRACSASSSQAVRLSASSNSLDDLRVALDRGEATVDGDGRSALVCALTYGHAEYVDVLLGHGADVDAPGWSGRSCESQSTFCDSKTPLTIAMEDGNDKLASSLVRHGARVDIPPPNSPLEWSISFGLDATFQAIRQRGVITTTDALKRAVDKDRVDMLNDLLDDGADANSEVVAINPSYPKVPLLVDAAGGGHTSSVQSLLRHGADPNKSGYFDPTDARMFVAMNNPDAGKLSTPEASFFDPYASVLAYWKAPPDKTITPLVAAAATGNASIVTLLLTAGADPDLPSFGSLTPLHASALNRSPTIANLLLAGGATNPPAGPPDRPTPSHIATSLSYNETASALAATSS